MHARRIRPETGNLDRHHLVAATLSALLPGLGQALNRRSRLAALFAVPSLVLALLAVLLLQLQSPARLVAWIVAPPVLGALLTLNLLVLAWRLLAVGQAYLDARRQVPTGWLGIAGVVVIVLLVGLPHLVVYRYGTILGDTFAEIFAGDVFAGDDEPGTAAGPMPGEGERINVLLVGVDALRDRAATLTDTMMVASLDPVGRSVSLLSVPRDLIDTPLGNGDHYGPKLNSLLGYADRHPEAFPDGGMPGLLDAVGHTVRSDVPVDRLPTIAAVLDEVDREDMFSVVIRFPLVHPKSTRHGASQEADLPAIRSMAARLFSAPGTPPIGWTPPK